MSALASEADIESAGLSRLSHQAVVLLTLVAIDVSDAILVAATLAAGSLCVVWATMTLSASINAQLDMITATILDAEK